MFNKILEKVKNRKLLVVAVLLFFAVIIFAITNTFTEKTTSTIWDGKIASKFKSGDGSAINPYVIDDGGELAYFFTLINAEDNTDYFNKFYEITNNIDLNGYDFSFAQFNKTFSGSLNGNGYTISNFTISKYYFDEEGKKVSYSLFDSLFSANIRNINFSDIVFRVDSTKIVKEETSEAQKTSLVNDDYKIKLVNETDLEDKKEENSQTDVVNQTSETPSSNETKTTEEKTNTDENETTEEKSSTDEIEVKENEEVKPAEDKKEEETVDNSDEVKEETKEEEIKKEETKEENKEDEVIIDDIDEINISLFKNVKQTTIENISVNDIEIDYTGNKDKVKSSLFILNDIENNTIENINMNGTSNLKETCVLFENYNEAKLKNIIFMSDNLKIANNISNTQGIYQYHIENGKLMFYEDYSTKAILDSLSSNSSLSWKLSNNKFRIVNLGSDGKKKLALRKSRSAPSAHDSGKSGSIIYVNEYDSDYDYYMGINYTYSSNGKIPTTNNKNIYSDSNLVYVQLNYHGADINNQYVGYVSYHDGENQNQFTYYKVYPLENGHVNIDLIDNPFSRRPYNKTFNGWITNYQDAEISLNTDMYVRKIKVPVDMNGSVPENIVIDLYAVWTTGKIVNYSNSWATTFGNLDSDGFHPVSYLNTVYEPVTQYYIRGTVNYYSWYPNGAVNYNGNSLSGRCTSNGGCTYYAHPTGDYTAGTQYYKLENGAMTPYTPTSTSSYVTEVPIGESIAGYYRRVNVPNGSSVAGYYNASGDLITSGNSTGAGYYELIQYYDSNNDPEVVVENQTYYYKTTRDTNVIVMSANITGAWSSSEDKPVTLTAINTTQNGVTNNMGNSYLNLNNRVLNCYADTRIENMRTYSNVGLQNDGTSPSGNASFVGNNYNTKIGRHVTANATNRVTFRYAIGSNTSGTSTAIQNYTFIVESGVYNNIGVTTIGASSSTDFYVHAFGTFGSDYAKVTEDDPEDDSEMQVRYILAGSWTGRIRADGITDVGIHTTIKSGKYGANKYDCYTGVYVGGLNSGSHYTGRLAIIEGGYIYNVLGGPLSQSTYKEYNDTYIYMKGGIVDIIVGGAGRTETYCNKIIQVTGGQVNYSIFGGSNGVQGNDSDQLGTVDGDTMVYVGGSAIIGDEDLVDDNSIESKSQVEAGSVFGIGNGRSGYNAIGTVNNSNVIINGGTVRRNVYGGGNYGATGRNGTNKTYATTIKILDGTIEGSVYGGGNNNGAGCERETSGGGGWGSSQTITGPNTVNITIEMTDGTVNGSVYGGSRTKGTIYGSTTLNIIGGTVSTDVYGGGEGGYTSSSNPGTFVDGNVDITIGNSTAGPRINGSVYGGSAYGTVNATSTNANANNKHVNVTVNNGTIVTSVFGGAKGSSTYTPYIKGDINVDINNGTITNVYGGFDQAGKPVGDVVVTIDGGSVVNAFGGGNQTSIDDTDISLTGGTVTNLYGGSNQNGTVKTTKVSITGGSAGSVYGGNNEGGSCTTTTVTVNGGLVTTALYGGGNLVDTTTTNVTVTNITPSATVTAIPNVYGGGNKAGATTTNVTVNGSGAKVTNLFGGSNQQGDVTNANVTISNGTITNAYGGNNEGGTTTNPKIVVSGGTTTTLFGGGNEATTGDTTVTINNGTVTTAFGGGNKAATGETNITVNNGAITNLYGGGNEAASTITNVTLNGNTGTITNVYGGGNKAGATTTNITSTSNSVHVGSMYGGSNTLGNVTTSNVNIQNGTITTVYGGNNAGGTTSTTNITVTTGTITTIYGGGNEAVSGDTNVTVNNGSVTNIYGGGNKAACADTVVTVNNASSAITNVFGGGNQAGADTTTVTIGTIGGANINIGGVYGGSNQLGAVTTSNVTVNSGTITSVYGGNNAGGTTGDAHVLVNGPTITNIYGGGDKAQTGSTDVVINGGSATNVYGGGNQAKVTGNTSLKLLGGSVPQNIYGGGNEGEVGGNTNVIIHNSTVGGSAYAGGNGATAIVHGNTNITISGTSTIGTSSCTNYSRCSVFGGGNAAATGTEIANNSSANVKIAGGTIYGNVYGGANTSKVYGSTDVNIGADVQTGTNVARGDIHIRGTVFGGGEANAAGSASFDFSFISVTQGVEVNINGLNYNNFDIDGSIFGSGNASSSEGDSYIYIKNYGTMANPKTNISIQRANLCEINNSAIVLEGATDRTNDFSDVLFTFSRVDEVDLKNNSAIFLENGANLLKVFKSLDASGNYATVTFNENTGAVTRSTDNRLYMLAGKHLDIAKDQNATDMGDVYGMTFFGMYKYNGNGTVNIGIYGEETDGDDVDWSKVFDNVTSYVAGFHKTNHNIEVDGFYTNYANEETQKYDVDYITPTPPTGPLYMWIIGAGVIEYELDLTASRYSTLGTSELSLRDFTRPNITFSVLGFDYSELASGVSLVNKTDVKKIADTANEADNVMGISVETSNTGWLNNGQTSFVTDPDNPVIGTDAYVKGNTTGAPTLLVYLHHSKNIATAGDMGTVRIQLMSIRQINALDRETKRLIITLNLSRILIDSNNYEGAMTPGRKYELFTSTTTNISSTSSISAFYSLFKTGTEIYKTGYHRTLVSTFVFPLNTKITMIDLSKNTPEYYYKVIDATELARAQTEFQNVGEASYNISMFEAMGAENSGVYYDDVAKNALYYDSVQQFANEEFIFIIDFGDTQINSDQLQNKLLLEMRNSNDATIYSVFAPQHDELTYNIYANKDALIDMDGEISANKIYNGDSFTADITIDYTQGMIGSTDIYDTHYFDSKLGIKISLINSDGDVVTGTTLLGLYYIIDEVRYDPNIDGTTRIKIADKVDDAEKWIIINTGTSAIASGHYKLRIESFGSPDGIYYGLNSSDYIDFDIEIVNEIYGLDVETTAEEMSINKDTGKNENGSNSIGYTIKYNSGLHDPNIRFKLYRRNYDNIDDTTYSLVDASDYFTDELTASTNENEYIISSDPDDEFDVSFTTGEDLVTGTYKMVFILYDDTSAIGTVEKYFIIK